MIVPRDLQKVTIAKSDFQIFTPSAQAIKNWYENTNPTPQFPYWAKIWPAAIALSDYIVEQQALFIGKTVIELGAGLGLPSFVAAKYAKSVLITDYIAEPLNYVSATINHYNYTNCRTAIYDWKYTIELPEADILLLSDLNYAPDNFIDIINLIGYALKKRTMILLATPQRMAGRDFIQSIEKHIQQAITKSVKISDADMAISIFIM